ncbi:exosortase A [Neptunomonas qingdaonensis]|uniref:Exosortase A n=1 Tax=Neptunomonas qingdaonensis TaxID=1045558 RepID=A0A1I2MVT9_9GAMM|nr:exosortase A [Neptunomonas qingdaonensis]SFF95208.1 exosortase A [Neptunomonas qingdaonensis]
MTMAAKNNMDISKQTGWRYFLPVVVIYLLLYTALFYETLGSMLSIWMRSETFTHAFLILPISIWLVWEKREHLQYEQPRPSWLGMTALTGCGFIWLFGYLVDALVVQQFAWVAAFISGVWAILGNRIAWAIAFPLAFLLFMIPFGEDLVPAMMEFTADFTVAMVRLTGIPVYREGLFFTLPSGNWSVVEACSGIRYLIASLTLGCLYSYLTYTSLKKRLIFIAFSIIVPIIANGLRAYIIVMLGHVSDMTVATGVDHLVYGWVFFGIVIFILIMIGSRFRDEDIDNKPNSKQMVVQSKQTSGLKQAIQSCIVAIVLIGFWPVFAYEIEKQEVNQTTSGIEPVTASENWTVIESRHWEWEPVSVGADKLNQYFRKEDTNIGLYLQYYFTQEQGAELINWRNVLLDPDLDDWRIIHQQKVNINIASKQVNVDETFIKGPDVQLLVWSWYRIGEYYTANKYVAKLLEGVAKISFSRSDAGKIIVAIPYDEKLKETERAALLQNFISEIMPDVERSIDKAAGPQ